MACHLLSTDGLNLADSISDVQKALYRLGYLFLGATKVADIFYWSSSLCYLQLSCVCTPEPTFYCFHGNLPKIQNSEIVKKICGSIPLRYLGGLAMKCWSFLAKCGFKVCISIFPWQPVWYLIFWCHNPALWPWQTICVRFRWDPSRNGREINRRKRVRGCLPVSFLQMSEAAWLRLQNVCTLCVAVLIF